MVVLIILMLIAEIAQFVLAMQLYRDYKKFLEYAAFLQFKLSDREKKNT